MFLLLTLSRLIPAGNKMNYFNRMLTPVNSSFGTLFVKLHDISTEFSNPISIVSLTFFKISFSDSLILKSISAENVNCLFPTKNEESISFNVRDCK